MEPLAYVRAFRQWWWLCAACVLVAAGAAYVTAPTADSVQQRVERETRYEATHILYRDGAPSADSMGLETLQLLVTTGDVPNRLAERLDWDDDPAKLVNEFTLDIDSQLGTVQVSTVKENPAKAERWADAYAAEIKGFLTRWHEQRHMEQITRMRQRRNEVKEHIRVLNAHIHQAGGEDAGGEAALLVAKRDALSNRYRSLVEQVQDLGDVDDGGVDPGLMTIQEATALAAGSTGDAGDVALTVPASRQSRVATASAVGLVVGVGLVLLTDRLDTRVRTRRAAEQAFGLPVIAEVPRFGRWSARRGEVLTATRPATPVAEAFRMLRLSLQLMGWRHAVGVGPVGAQHGGNGNGNGHRVSVGNGYASSVGNGYAPDGNGKSAGHEPPDRPGQAPDTGARDPDNAQVVLVTSTAFGDGKTTTVTNLAAAFAETGQRVLVLDCNLRMPVLHRAFGQEPGAGLTDALADPDRFGEPIELARPTNIDGVRLLQAGVATQQPWKAKRPDRETLDRLRDHADVILIDSGPALLLNDPMTVMPAVDTVLVVARSGRTTIESAERISELLDRVHAPTIGVALNGVSAANRTTPRGGLGYGNAKPWARRSKRRRGPRASESSRTVDVAAPAGENPDNTG